MMAQSKRRTRSAPKPRPLAILIEAADGRSDRWIVRVDPEQGRETVTREFDNHAHATDYAHGVAFVAQCPVVDQTLPVDHEEGVDLVIGRLTDMLPPIEALEERYNRSYSYKAGLYEIRDTRLPAVLVHMLIAAIGRLRAERDGLLWQLSLVPPAGEA